MRKAEADDSIHLIEAALRNFVCIKDADIEEFLHEKAIPFQRRKLCSTYLIVDEAAFHQGRIYIEAYFTLSHKSIVVPPDLSKQKVRAVAGFKDASSIHFVLIGQLGKRIDSVSAAPLHAQDILNYAFAIIRASDELIPCRCVLVECIDNPKVQKVYTDYGFKFLQAGETLHQFYRTI